MIADLANCEERWEIVWQQTPDTRSLGQKVFDELCDDPEVWATHGCPSEHKEALIVAAIDRAIATALPRNHPETRQTSVNKSGQSG